MIQSWINWYIALLTTSVSWLGSMKIADVSLLWIMGACFILGLLIRALLIKP